MKQNIIRRSPGPMTIGMDLGDRVSCYCLLNPAGAILKEEPQLAQEQAAPQ